MKFFEKPIGLFKAKLAFPLFRLVHKSLSRKGLERFALIRSVYEFLCLRLMPKDITFVVLEGMKINLPGSHTPSSLTAHLLMHGVWERSQTKLFKESIHRGMVIADIGAHGGGFGLYSG